MTKYHSLCFFLCLVLFNLILIHPSCASNNNVTELVDEVCAKTSNYSFCVESLYSDPRTPGADRYDLAYVAFSLAYQNATSTSDYIQKLLKEGTSTPYCMSLRRCANDYEKAVNAMANALFDLDSQTFFELADLAGDASRAAQDCQATSIATHDSLLHFMNNALNGLCEIGVVIAQLFTHFTTS